MASALGNHCTHMQIPVVDLSGLHEQTADQLVKAVAEYGFVFVRGEGLGFTAQILNDTFALSKEFFASPTEEKQKSAPQAANSILGWSSMHAETLDPKNQKRGDFKETFNLGVFVDGKAQQTLARTFAPHEADLCQFSVLCHKLCMKLLRLFALGLQVDPSKGGDEYFSSRHNSDHGPSGTVLRFLHYPAIDKYESVMDNTTDIRAGAHSDYGSLTLLFQRASQSGLEVLTPSSTWSPVPIFPPGTEADAFPPILVNIGDLMHLWTNGSLKSTVHRVVFPEGESEDRYSIAYFCYPRDEVELESVPSKLIKEKAKHIEHQDEVTITAKEYLQKRLTETYGWGK